MKKLFVLSIILASIQFATAATVTTPNSVTPQLRFSQLSEKDQIIAAHTYHMKTLNKEKQQQTLQVIQALSTYKPTRD